VLEFLLEMVECQEALTLTKVRNWLEWPRSAVIWKKRKQEYHLLQPIASENMPHGTCQFIHMKLHWDTCWSRDPTVIWCWTAAFIHTTMRETHTTQLWWHLQCKQIEG
jgi:hypothetical protein